MRLLQRSLVLFALCAPVPAAVSPAPTWPEQSTTTVSTTDELSAAFAAPRENITILLADGTYRPTGTLRIRGARVVVRGASGDRDRVVIDGSQIGNGEGLWLESCSDCAIADLTVADCAVHGITIKGESGVARPLIHNVRLHNIWERGIKGTKSDDPANRVVGGRVQHCRFDNDTAKVQDDWQGGDYIAGCDLMQLKDWVFCDNEFVGIRGRNGGGRGAIFLWVSSEDVVVERNRFIGCDRAICFGNPSGDVPYHMLRGVARGNRIVRGASDAIELARTRGCAVVDNTVWSADLDYSRMIHVFMGEGGHEIARNLLRTTAPVIEDPGCVVADNVIGSLDGAFVDPANGDLRLTSAGVAQAGGRGATQDGAAETDRGAKSTKEAKAAKREQIAASPAPTPEPGVDAASAVDHDRAWRDVWATRAREWATSAGKRAGLVIHVGDGALRASAYGMWPGEGRGLTDSDRATCAWLGARQAWPDQLDADDGNGWYLAAAAVSPQRGFTAADGLSAAELVSGDGNGGAAMPAVAEPMVARALLADGAHLPGNLRIETIAAAYADAQVAVVQIGGEDLRLGRLVELIAADIDAIVDALARRRIVVVLATLPPHPDAARGRLVDDLNRRLRELARARALPLLDLAREASARGPAGALVDDGGAFTASALGLDAAEDPYADGGDPAIRRTGAACAHVGALLQAWVTVQKLDQIRRYVGD